MVAWSLLALNNIKRGVQCRSLLSGSKSALQFKGINVVPARFGGHGPRTLEIRDSEYYYAKVKNYFHFYAVLGIAPTVLLGLYCNIFIGDAKLAAIPEGYEPKHWEYYKHPITRFLARYVLTSPQEDYERNLHNLFIMKEKQLIGHLEQKIEDLMKERVDYQAWYFHVPMAKYPRALKEGSDDRLKNSLGRGMCKLHV